MAAKDDEVARLRARVEQLEQLLTARQEPQEITAEEIAAYRKVSDVLAFDWGGSCGINECYRPPVVIACIRPCVVRCIVRCVNECTCGPCAQVNPTWTGGGLARFEQFGG